MYYLKVYCGAMLLFVKESIMETLPGTPNTATYTLFLLSGLKGNLGGRVKFRSPFRSDDNLDVADGIALALASPSSARIYSIDGTLEANLDIL